MFQYSIKNITFALRKNVFKRNKNMAKEQKKKEDGFEQLEGALTSGEQFVEKNQKMIVNVIIGIIVVVAAYFGYNRFISAPKATEAANQIFGAQNYFERDSFNLALNGDGNVLGFAQVIEDYGSKAGQSVYLYAGVCELQLGKYNEAIGYLSKYKGKDSILAARALACIGDAYVGLGEYATAVGYFEKAASRADNIYAAAYLLKAGVTYEEMGQDEKALSMYKKIKDQYPQSMEGYDIDKYISRIQAK